MHLDDAAILLYAVYVPFLIILYILELVVIFRQRKQQTNGSFHRIFSVLAVVNISACLLGSFVFRLNLYPLVNRFYGEMERRSGWITAAYAGAYYLNCLSEFLGVLQALNRFTATYFPMRHDKIWRWAFYVDIAFCLLVSFPPICKLLHDSTAYVEVFNPLTNYSWYFLNAFSDEQQAKIILDNTAIWINMFIVSVICNSTAFTLYIACLIRLCLFSATRNSIIERNFFLVGFLNMVFSLPYMGAMLIFFVTPTNSPIYFSLMMFVTFQLPWLTDLKYLTPAPMLLITNKAIRESIKSLLFKSILPITVKARQSSTTQNTLFESRTPKITQVSIQ